MFTIIYAQNVTNMYIFTKFLKIGYYEVLVLPLAQNE